MTDKDAYNKARKRVKKKKQFYVSFGMWAFFSIFLFFLNILTNPEDLWFYYPVLGWGVAIGFQYVDAFGPEGFGLGKDWEEKEIQKELNRNNNPYKEDVPTIPDDELELKEFKKLRDEWNDQDFV